MWRGGLSNHRRKDVRQSKVGDTVTTKVKPASNALKGYSEPKPMVFSGIYPIDGGDYPNLREALDKLRLSDASLVYEPETSAALGFGFRCGFLGLLHLEIITERLEREFNLSLIATAPSVVYEVTREDGLMQVVTNPHEFPEGKIKDVAEPIVRANFEPEGLRRDNHGALPELPWTMIDMQYLGEDRVQLRYELPLAEIVFDFLTI